MPAQELILAGGGRNGKHAADNVAPNGVDADTTPFILPEIKTEPIYLDHTGSGLSNDDYIVSTNGDHSSQEDTKDGIILSTATSSNVGSFVPIQIKTEQILPEVQMNLTPTSTLTPSAESLPAIPTGRPVRWILIKKEPEDSGDQVPSGLHVKSKPVPPASVPLLVVPQGQMRAPRILRTATLAPPPRVTNLANRTIFTPLVMTQSPVSPAVPAVTVIRPTPFELLRPKPVVSTRPGAVVTPVRISDVPRHGGTNRRKQVFAQVRHPGSTTKQPTADTNSVSRPHHTNKPPEVDSYHATNKLLVVDSYRPSSNVRNTGVPTAEPKPQTKATLGVNSVEYSAAKALRQLAPKTAASVLTPLPAPYKQWQPPAAPAQTRGKTVGILRRRKAGVLQSPRQPSPSVLEPCIVDVDQVDSPGAADEGKAPLRDDPAEGVAIVSLSTPPDAAGDEFAELIEFEPDIFDVDSESNDNPPILDFPAILDDGSGPSKRHRGSRKRIIQQPPAILPPPSLTPNGISQSGLVRQPRGNRSRSTVNEYICEFEGCGKVFIRKQNLRDHRRVHTNDRPYKCKFCGKAFKQASHVIDHQRLHTKVKPFLCRVCGAGFVQAGQLNNHIRCHTSDRRRPFPCPHCPFGGAEQDELDAHVREAHVLPTMVDPTRSLLDCSLCIYRGVNKTDLEEHMNRHVHLRKYACSECKYRAHTKSRLEMHMMLHTGEKPYPCSACGRCFRQKSQRETHFASQHRFAGQSGRKRRQQMESSAVDEVRRAEAVAHINVEPASADVDIKPVILEEVICPD